MKFAFSKKRELAVNESDNEVAVKAKHDVDKPQFPTAVEARQRNSALIKVTIILVLVQSTNIIISLF